MYSVNVSKILDKMSAIWPNENLADAGLQLFIIKTFHLVKKKTFKILCGTQLFPKARNCGNLPCLATSVIWIRFIYILEVKVFYPLLQKKHFSDSIIIINHARKHCFQQEKRCAILVTFVIIIISNVSFMWLVLVAQTILEQVVGCLWTASAASWVPDWGKAQHKQTASRVIEVAAVIRHNDSQEIYCA